MDQGVKIIAAVGVLGAGIVVAMMFRHETPPREPATPRQESPLLLRKDLDGMPVADGEYPNETDPNRPGMPTHSGPATIVSPRHFAEPPLNQDYPGVRRGGTSGWGTQRGMMPAARPGGPRTHKIVDGDTLEALAERYLGSADRYREIYEANRAVLPSPQLLPIGVKLKIPPEGIKVSPSRNMLRKRPLVPLH